VFSLLSPLRADVAPKPHMPCSLHIPVHTVTASSYRWRVPPLADLNQGCALEEMLTEPQPNKCPE
jgi:hypothetical protein